MARELMLAVLLLASAPAAAETLATVKAGEWVMTMDTGAARPKAGEGQRVCYKTDRAFTEADLNRGGQRANCTTTTQREGDTFRVQSLCHVDKMTMTSNFVMTHTGDSDMTMIGTTHVEGGSANMPSELPMTIHWHRTGPCQPGDRPAPEQP